MHWIVLLLCAVLSPVLWALGACQPPPAPVCGDGKRIAAPATNREGCDDGNTDDTDACLTTCEPVPFLLDGNLDDFSWMSYPVPHSATLASDGDGLVLALWIRETPDCVELRAHRLSPFGAPWASGPDPARPAACTDFDPTDDSFVVATSTDGDIDAAVVGLEDGWAIAYTVTRFGQVDIATRTISKTALLGHRWIANHTEAGELIEGNQTAPRLVAQNGSYVVAWVDEAINDGGQSQIWARAYGDPFATANEPLANPFLVADEPDAAMSQVTLGGIGTRWTAAWLRDDGSHEIHLRRYTGTTPDDLEPVPVAVDATTPELFAQADGTVFVGYTTTYPFDAHVVRVASGTSVVEPVISFSNPNDPTETILALERFDGELGIAYAANSVAQLEAVAPVSPFAPSAKPPEWSSVVDALGAALDANVNLHAGAQGVWVSWSGVGAGTLDLGTSIHYLPPEFGP